MAGITTGVLVMVAFVSVTVVVVWYFYRNGDLKFRFTKSPFDYDTRSLDQMSVTSVTSSERPSHNLERKGSKLQIDEQFLQLTFRKLSKAEKKSFRTKINQ